MTAVIAGTVALLGLVAVVLLLRSALRRPCVRCGGTGADAAGDYGRCPDCGGTGTRRSGAASRRGPMGRLARGGQWLLWLVFPVIGRPDRVDRKAELIAEELADQEELDTALSPYHEWESRQDPHALAAYRTEVARLPWHRRTNARHYGPLMRKHGIEPPPAVAPPLHLVQTMRKTRG